VLGGPSGAIAATPAHCGEQPTPQLILPSIIPATDTFPRMPTIGVSPASTSFVDGPSGAVDSGTSDGSSGAIRTLTNPMPTTGPVGSPSGAIAQSLENAEGQSRRDADTLASQLLLDRREAKITKADVEAVILK